VPLGEKEQPSLQKKGGKGERKGSALRTIAIAENGISESTTVGGVKGAAVLDRDLDYAGASRIAKILPIRKKGECPFVK